MLDPELVRGFVSDSLEMLDEVEPFIIGLQQAYKDQGVVDKETLNAIFRLFHSLKGASAFLGLQNITNLTHEAENLLNALREGKLALDGRHVDVILEGCDFIRRVLPQVEQKGTDEGFEGEAQAIIERIHRSMAESPPTETQDRKLKDQPSPEPPPQPTPEVRAKADIRVDLEKLNELNDLIGELVIAETMVVRNPDLEGKKLENFEKAAHQLHLIISSLQDLAMALRMVPIGGLFRRMIRVVHDTAKRTGKEVELRLKGEETEVDKTVIEAISDPLVHLVRNAIDHGIEPPEERQRLRKPRKGMVELEARHEGGEVVVSVRDDGRGLDREAILQKARERGLIEGGDVLPDEEVFQLIFLPGFSTAKEVTDISGRGVGMDVVKKKVEELRGWIEVKSKPSQGTTIALHLPLTLAIIDGLLVKVGELIFVIPLYSVKELFTPDSSKVTHLPGGRVVIQRHGKLFPVARLGDIFALQGAGDSGDFLLVLLEHKDRSLCLAVDEVLGQRDIVVKPLPRVLGRARGISGCSILEDEGVCLILDVQGLMERVGYEVTQNLREGGGHAYG